MLGYFVRPCQAISLGSRGREAVRSGGLVPASPIGARQVRFSQSVSGCLRGISITCRARAVRTQLLITFGEVLRSIKKKKKCTRCATNAPNRGFSPTPRNAPAVFRLEEFTVGLLPYNAVV